MTIQDQATIFGCPMMLASEMDLTPYCESGRFKNVRGRLFRSQYLNRGKFPVTFIRDLQEKVLVVFVGLDAIDPIGGLNLDTYLRDVDPRCNGLWTKVEHAVLEFMGGKKRKKKKHSAQGELQFSQRRKSRRRVRRQPLLTVINDVGPEV